jgi:hypothetical protein
MKRRIAIAAVVMFIVACGAAPESINVVPTDPPIVRTAAAIVTAAAAPTAVPTVVLRASDTQIPLEVRTSFAIGADQHSGAFDVLIVAIERIEVLDGLKPTGIFVRVVLNATNMGTEPDRLAMAQSGGFLLIDQTGRRFAYDADATTASALPERWGIDAELQPGLSQELVVVFDVPTDATEFVLVPLEKE